MKLPNSYGSVIKLGGKRRKPYAVRISKLVEDDTGKVKRKYTYLAYTYGTYMNGNFNTCMGKLKMKHLPHDGRHTFASLMDSTGANGRMYQTDYGTQYEKRHHQGNVHP